MLNDNVVLTRKRSSLFSNEAVYIEFNIYLVHGERQRGWDVGENKKFR